MSADPRAFEAFLRSTHRVLARERGAAFADGVVAAARAEHRRLLPQVPDIGGASNVFQPVMTVNGWLVALHRALVARGGSAEDTVRTCQEVFDGWLRRLPGFALRALGRLLLGAPVRGYLERQARRSQLRRHPEDFVWRVERGAGGEVALIFEECAVNKWYAKLGETDLAPYCNFADVTYSRLMGMGVDATRTIGLGCDRCELRFVRGRETRIPPPLEGIVSRRQASPGARARRAARGG